MHDSFYKIVDFVKKWKNDPLSIDMDEYYEISRHVVDLVFKNKDTCNLKQQSDDFKNWCLENKDICVDGKGMETRIIENAVDIVGTLLDVFHLLMKDDTCYTGQEQLDEMYRFMKDFGQINASVMGFDHKWDQSLEQKHIKSSVFRSAVKNFYLK